MLRDASFRVFPHESPRRGVIFCHACFLWHPIYKRMWKQRQECVSRMVRDENIPLPSLSEAPLNLETAHALSWKTQMVSLRASVAERALSGRDGGDENASLSIKTSGIRNMRDTAGVGRQKSRRRGHCKGHKGTLRPSISIRREGLWRSKEQIDSGWSKVNLP